MKRAAFLIALILAVVIVAAWQRDMAAARARVGQGSKLVATSWGPVEWAESGTGPPLLMIHGTGGGFDQGLLFADAVRGHGLHVLAPSRFGYLRSGFPSDPSPQQQAKAFAALLDHLGIKRVAVAGGSAGALSAAAFALEYPERCAALILLVPAGNVTGRDPVQMTPWQERMVAALAGSDFLYWSALQATPGMLTRRLLATDPELVAHASPAEQRRVGKILRTMLPISRRTRGMIEDARRAGEPQAIDYAAIRVPTLIISVEDDRFGTAATARLLAATIPAARRHIYAAGGHVWVGHDADMARRIADFVKAAFDRPAAR